MLAEWHLPPDYIVNNWTDELLDLMVVKLVERKDRIAKPVSSGGGHKVSDKMLFAQAGNLIKTVKGDS